MKRLVDNTYPFSVRAVILGLLLSPVCGLFLLLLGCEGEAVPDPEPPLEPPPVIDHFERPSDGTWERTDRGARGSTIGVVGTHFGDNIDTLKVYYNGAPALIDRIEDYPGTGWKRIVTAVPEKATTGPVTVSHAGTASQGKTFYVIQIISSARAWRFLFGEPGSESSDVWIATFFGGLIHFDGRLSSLERGDFRQYTTGQRMLTNTVEAVIRDQVGRLIVGTSGGLGILTDDRFESFTVKTGVATKSIVSLYLTQSGDLLVGTYQGLAVWRNYAGEADPARASPEWKRFLTTQVNDFLPSTDGGLLIATYEGLYKAYADESGEFEWDDSHVLRRLYPRATEAMSPWPLTHLAFDHQGNLVAGTINGGILYFDRSQDYSVPRIYPISDYPLNSNSVADIACSSDGKDLYLATYGGLYRVRMPVLGNALEIELLMDGEVYSVKAAPDSRRIFVGSKQRLSTFEEGDNGPVNWEHSTTLNMLSDNLTQSLAPDGAGGVFIGTRSGGLMRFNGDFAYPSFRRSTKQVAEIPYVDVLTLCPVPDGEGEMWLGTSGGLGHLSYSDSAYSFEPLIDYGPSEHGVSQVLPLEGGNLLMGTVFDGLLFHSPDMVDPYYRTLSAGTGFTISADDFHMDDFSFPLPFYDWTGNRFAQYSVTNIRLIPQTYRPAGGTINCFKGEGTRLYAYLGVLCDVDQGGVKGKDQPLPLVFKGAVDGVHEYGQIVTLKLEKWLYGIETRWRLFGNALTTPDLVNMMITAQSRTPTNPESGGTYSFDFDHYQSGMYLFNLLRLTHLSGHFTAHIEELPVPEESATPTMFITSLLRDAKGIVLVGTQEDGLFTFDPKEQGKGFKHITEGVSGLPEGISALAMDQSGRVYAGTFQDGIYRLEGYTTSSPSIIRIGEDRMLSQCVTALRVDSSNHLLIGIYDEQNMRNCGLTVYSNYPDDREQRYVNLTSRDGLIKARIQDILVLDRDLYLATSQGVCVIQKFSDFISSQFANPKNSISN